METGKGTSVLELVKAFEEANGIEVPYEIVNLRPRGIASCYVDVSKVKRKLRLKANPYIIAMCRGGLSEKNYKGIDQLKMYYPTWPE